MDGNGLSLHNLGFMTSGPTIPCKRDKHGWLAEHMKHIELSKNPRVGRVLLIGDETFGALPNFPQVWSRHLAPLLVLNYGLCGDETQHVLWRVQNGLVPLNVEIVVIYAGGNNLGSSKSKDIANGIACIASILRSKKVDIKIVICGLLPTCTTYSNKFGRPKQEFMKKSKNVNKYLKSFCKKGNISDCYYLKPDDDWLVEGSMDSQYHNGAITEKGYDKFTKSITAIIELLKVGVKVEFSSDSEIESEEEIAVPKKPKSKPPKIPPNAMAALQSSVKAKKNNIVLQEMKESRKRSRSKTTSSSSQDKDLSKKEKRPTSASSVERHRRRSHRKSSHRSRSPTFKKSPLRCSKHLSESKKVPAKLRSRSKSRSNSSSRAISPVFTVKRHPDGKVSRSPSPIASPVKRKSISKSPELIRESIITPGARARSRSLSKCRSRSKSGSPVEKDEERDRWLQRASERISPDEAYQVKSCWDPSPNGTGYNTPELQDSETANDSHSTAEMYGRFMKELEEMASDKDEVSATTKGAES